jgi:hypothetical protein
LSTFSPASFAGLLSVACRNVAAAGKRGMP